MLPVSSHAGGQTPADASYGTDRCARSSSKTKPIVQYVIMIDAGSTGSRIHVYKFNNCGPAPELESELFKMTEKSVGGLSAERAGSAGPRLGSCRRPRFGSVPSGEKVRAVTRLTFGSKAARG